MTEVKVAADALVLLPFFFFDDLLFSAGRKTLTDFIHCSNLSLEGLFEPGSRFVLGATGSDNPFSVLRPAEKSRFHIKKYITSKKSI